MTGQRALCHSSRKRSVEVGRSELLSRMAFIKTNTSVAPFSREILDTEESGPDLALREFATQ